MLGPSIVLTNHPSPASLNPRYTIQSWVRGSEDWIILPCGVNEATRFGFVHWCSSRLLNVQPLDGAQTCWRVTMDFQDDNPTNLLYLYRVILLISRGILGVRTL